MKKRDFSTGFGLLSGVVVIAISLLWGQNNISKTLRLFIDIPSIFIVMLGSFSSIIISFQWDTIKDIPTILNNAFVKKQKSKIELIVFFVDFAKLARREGLLSLENEISNIDDNYIKMGIQMVVDGFEEETIKNIMENEMDKTNGRHKRSIQVFRMWANLAPSYGMLGTFIGLILMMSNFKDMSKFGSAFATVLVTSFYGAILSNLVFAPLANKLDIKNMDELDRMELILEGIINIQSGTNPRIMEEDLKTFLSNKDKIKYDQIASTRENREKGVIDHAA